MDEAYDGPVCGIGRRRVGRRCQWDIVIKEMEWTRRARRGARGAPRLDVVRDVSEGFNGHDDANGPG